MFYVYDCVRLRRELVITTNHNLEKKQLNLHNLNFMTYDVLFKLMQKDTVYFRTSGQKTFFTV